MGIDTKKDKFVSIQVNMSIIKAFVYIDQLILRAAMLNMAYRKRTVGGTQCCAVRIQLLCITLPPHFLYARVGLSDSSSAGLPDMLS